VLRWAVLVGLYLASRLFALTTLPMFLDERIYLRWAYWITQGRRLQVPFVAGKGLSVWVLAAVTPQAANPLLAGRLLTVAVGILTLVAVHRLAARLTGDVRLADVAAVFYVACPFTLFHDRMVLTDPYLSAFTAWTLLLALRLAGTPRPRHGALLGAAMALGISTKVTGLPLLALPLLVLVVMGGTRRAWVKPLALAYAVALALIAYPVWRFFSRPSGELSKLAGSGGDDSPVAATVSANLGLALSWLWGYWTTGLVLLAAVGVVVALRTSALRRSGVLLILVAVGPVALFASVARVWFPRYVLFSTVPLVILAALGFRALLDAIRRRSPVSAWTGPVLTTVLLAVVLAPALRFDAALWTDPSRAPLPDVDRFQYVTGWPSGYGGRDSIAFLRARRAERPEGLTLVTPGPSITASAVRLLWARDPAIDVRAVDPSGAVPVPADGAGPVYVVVSVAEGVRLPAHWTNEVTREFASFKPDGTPADELYRVAPRSR
jgi:hypothetical protein